MNRFYNYNLLKQSYANCGYKFYDKGAYNINIFGVRNDDLTPNEFNDVIGVAYRDSQNRPQLLMFQATTDPGASFLGQQMGNKNGTAILKTGQYFGAWKLGQHKGRYDALVQSEKAEFKVWRDNNQDRRLTLLGQTYSDVTGLNMHTTSFINEVARIGAYSAGCQVVADDKEFLILMAIINKSAERYGKYFSYTLFEQSEMY